MKLFILGAGKPENKEKPASLQITSDGKIVLDWQISALQKFFSGRPTLVIGYGKEHVTEDIQNQFQIVENPQWEHTGGTGSLLAAPLNGTERITACYGDIVFQRPSVKELFKKKADVVVAYDSAWKMRYAGRPESDLIRCEKVVTNGNKIVTMGAEIPVDWATGEFIGLATFGPKAVRYLKELQKSKNLAVSKYHISGLIEYLRLQGLTIKGVDFHGQWAEVRDQKDIAHFVLGTKAETLKRLEHLVKHSTIQEQVAFTVKDWKKNSKEIVQTIINKFDTRQLVVRSSALSEDAFTHSNAGAYTSVLGVSGKQNLKHAISTVIQSYDSPIPEDQVLLQPMVTDVIMSGVAFTRTLEYGAPWYVINYTRGTSTDDITSGNSKEHHTYIQARFASKKPEDKNIVKLLDAIKEIEQLLHYDSLDIEFAIDQESVVHILQVRPIAAQSNDTTVTDSDCLQAIKNCKTIYARISQAPPHLPNTPPLYGIMPDWNPAEIIGTNPGLLAESIYRYLIMDEIWATQRAEFGYKDVRPAPLMVNFAGKPYVDVRSSITSFIPKQIPADLTEKLVSFYTNWLIQHPTAHDKLEFEVLPTCYSLNFDSWEQRFQDNHFDTEEIKLLKQSLAKLTQDSFSKVSSYMDSIEILKERFALVKHTTALDPVEKARILLADCKQFGTLAFSHLARCGFIAVTLLKSAVETSVISKRAFDSFFSTISTVSHTLSMDASAVEKGLKDRKFFIEEYGHLRPGTYDITSPRYDKNPEKFLDPLIQQSSQGVQIKADPEVWNVEKSSLHKSLLDEGFDLDIDTLEGFLRKAIEGRELAKFEFSKLLSLALECIAELGDRKGLSREEMSNIPIDMILAHRDLRYPNAFSGQSLKQMAQAAKQNRIVARSCELPALITSIDDFERFFLGADQPNFIGSKSVSAPCTILDQPTSIQGNNLKDTIVLIPQADPGFDWLFGQEIAGLITLYGGANSHMAIRAAEFALPAAIGVGEQRYKELLGSSMIELDPIAKVVRRIH